MRGREGTRPQAILTFTEDEWDGDEWLSSFRLFVSGGGERERERARGQRSSDLRLRYTSYGGVGGGTLCGAACACHPPLSVSDSGLGGGSLAPPVALRSFSLLLDSRDVSLASSLALLFSSFSLSRSALGVRSLPSRPARSSLAAPPPPPRSSLPPPPPAPRSSRLSRRSPLVSGVLPGVFSFFFSFPLFSLSSLVVLVLREKGGAQVSSPVGSQVSSPVSKVGSPVGAPVS